MCRKNKLAALCILCFAGIPFYYVFPSYVFLLYSFLLIPICCLISYKTTEINLKKLVTIIGLCILIGIVWDYFSITLGIWSFPNGSSLLLLLGIPIEEILFFILYPTLAILIYLSQQKHNNTNWLHIPESIALSLVGLIQILILIIIYVFKKTNYLSLLMLFAGVPTIYFLFKRGERINKLNLLFTVIIMVFISILIDHFAIVKGVWSYNDEFLIGKIGIIPIESIFFAVFISTLTIGLYSSLPENNILKGKFK